MDTTGFAAFFRDPAVAAAGGVAMLPLGVLGAVRALRWRGDRGAPAPHG
jgi:adenosylmethionine-8-amino-7-oxononanoate aminotransferase